MSDLNIKSYHIDQFNGNSGGWTLKILALYTNVVRQWCMRVYICLYLCMYMYAYVYENVYIDIFIYIYAYIKACLGIIRYIISS